MFTSSLIYPSYASWIQFTFSNLFYIRQVRFQDFSHICAKFYQMVSPLQLFSYVMCICLLSLPCILHGPAHFILICLITFLSFWKQTILYHAACVIQCDCCSSVVKSRCQYRYCNRMRTLVRVCQSCLNCSHESWVVNK